MTRRQTIGTGVAALVTLIACALLPAAHTPTQVGFCGLFGTLGLIAFVILMGDD